MRFEFDADRRLWIGALVTNGEFARYQKGHRGESEKPVVGLPFGEAINYVSWLNEDKSGLPADGLFRLPGADELKTGASGEWVVGNTGSEDASVRGFRVVLDIGTGASAEGASFPALVVAVGLLGIGLIAVALRLRPRLVASEPVTINSAAATPAAPIRVPSGDDAAGYDLVIASSDRVKDPMVLASSPAEVASRNSSIVTSILDVRQRAARERQVAAAAPPPKLPKLKPAKAKPKRQGPLAEDTWDQLVAAEGESPEIELPAGAKPEVVEDETRDDFELPRHTGVKRTKNTVNTIKSLDDNTLNSLMSGDDLDFDDFLNSVD